REGTVGTTTKLEEKDIRKRTLKNTKPKDKEIIEQIEEEIKYKYNPKTGKITNLIIDGKTTKIVQDEKDFVTGNFQYDDIGDNDFNPKNEGYFSIIKDYDPNNPKKLIRLQIESITEPKRFKKQREKEQKQKAKISQQRHKQIEKIEKEKEK